MLLFQKQKINALKAFLKTKKAKLPGAKFRNMNFVDYFVNSLLNQNIKNLISIL
jgi:hypothetical protein